MNEGINYQRGFMFQLNSPLTLQQRLQVEPMSPILTLHLLCYLGQVTISKLRWSSCLAGLLWGLKVNVSRNLLSEWHTVKTQSRVNIIFPQFFHLPQLSGKTPCIQTVLDLCPGHPLPSKFPFPHILYDLSLHYHREWPLGTLQNPNQEHRPILSWPSSYFSRKSQGMGRWAHNLFFTSSEISHSQNIAHNLLGQVTFLILVAVTTWLNEGAIFFLK